MAPHQFDNLHVRHSHRVAEVGFRQEEGSWADVPPVLVEVRRLLCASCVSADTLLCHFGIEGSHPFHFIYHCRVSCHRSLQLLMPKILHSSLLCFSNFSVRYLNYSLCFDYCGMLKPSVSHSGPFQNKMHVGLFQLYNTLLPRYSGRHVYNLQGFSCGF